MDNTVDNFNAQIQQKIDLLFFAGIHAACYQREIEKGIIEDYLKIENEIPITSQIIKSDI